MTTTKKSRKGIGGRKRKGTLEFRGGSWHARLTITRDGESVREWFDMETTSKPVARRRMAKKLLELATGEAPAREAIAADLARRETVAEAFERIVDSQQKGGLVSHKERRARLAKYATPLIGNLDPTQVTAGHIREVLEGARDDGKAHQTIVHLKNDLSGVFGSLWRDQLIGENPMDRVIVPEGAHREERERIVLTDEEFAQFMACPTIDPELHTMALASRSFGGMRTSDLHAWAWSHVDLVNWYDSFVPRPKTKKHKSTAKNNRIVLPDVLVPVLQAWWDSKGRPTTGPVFPCRKGPRAGLQKQKMSYARPLREALWEAGVVRPLAGYDKALAEFEALKAAKAEPAALEGAEAALKRQCLIQAGSEDEYLPLDFHSFRRSYATSLAALNLNTAQSMALAGHRSPTTHANYVKLAQRGALKAPEEAAPKLPPRARLVLPQVLDVTPEAENETSMISSGRDRSRTCDIRLVSVTEDSESSVKHTESVSDSVDKKPGETYSDGSKGRFSRTELGWGDFELFAVLS